MAHMVCRAESRATCSQDLSGVLETPPVPRKTRHMKAGDGRSGPGSEERTPSRVQMWGTMPLTSSSDPPPGAGCSCRALVKGGLGWSFLQHLPPLPLETHPTCHCILNSEVCVQVKPPRHPLVFARNSCNTGEATHPPRSNTTPTETSHVHCVWARVSPHTWFPTQFPHTHAHTAFLKVA